jgi:PmbA protein
VAKVSIDEALVSGARRVSGAVRGNYVEIYLATSKANTVLSDSYTNVYLDVRAFVDGEDSGHASQLARNIDGLDPERLGREAGETAKLSTKTVSVDPGRYDTVATPNAAAALVNLVGNSASGFYVLMGRSFFRDRLGDDVAYEGLTINDNPHSPLSRIPRSFDDEAMPTRKNTIIKEGRLTTYLHNRFTAKVFDADLTGNAGWIMPSAWHLEVSPGDMSRDELVEELDHGFILNNVTYIRFQNHIKGDFSGVIRDGLFYVENGEIKGAVKGLRFSDNMPRILNNIVGIGKDVENIFHWWIRLDVTTPSLLIKDCGYTKAFGL